MCSAAARGLWVEMLCVMHLAKPYGHLLVNGQSPNNTQLAVLTGIPTEQVSSLLAELETAGVFSRTLKHVIYSRRMTRDDKRAREGKKHVERRWSQTPENKEENLRPNRSPNSTPKPQKPEARVIFEGKIIRLKEETFNAWLAESGMTEQAFEKWLDAEDESLMKLPEEQRVKWVFYTKAKIKKMRVA